MKIKIFAALAATAILISLSCNWFRSGKKPASNPLAGEWKLDSIQSGKDSSSLFYFVMIMTDSAGVNVMFTKDSVFTRSKDHVDSVAYSFNEKTHQLLINDSSQVLTYARLNDSMISLATNDSTILFLQKK
jgi:hypothetical protein